VLEATDCLICSHSEFRLLYNNDRYGIPSETVLCRNCGFIYSNPRMNEQSTSKFYESDIYREIYGGIESESLENYLQRYQYDPGKKYDINTYFVNESFFLFLKELNIAYETVCEIGAGGGWNLVPFMEDGKKTTGYEPSRILCDMGKEKGINLRRGFLEDISGDFDLVILRHVLEHFPDPLSALRKIRKHTRRYLAVEVPGIVECVPSIQNAHNMYFSLNTLQKLLSMAGFACLRIVYFKSNNFITALFEKTDQYSKFSYDCRKEIVSVSKVYNRERAIYITLEIMRAAGLYRLYKKVKQLRA